MENEYSVIDFDTLLCRQDINYCNIGPVPFSEQCTQAGESYYLQELECTIYAHQVIRHFGNPPSGCKIVLLHTFHDEAGQYLETAILYPEDNDPADAYIAIINGGMPHWDALALNELVKNKHPLYVRNKSIYS